MKLRKLHALLLGGALAFAPVSAQAAWSAPTNPTNGFGNSSAASTVQTGNVTIAAGHLVAVQVFSRGATISSVTDPAGNTYTLPTPCQRTPNTDYMGTAYSKLTNALSAQKITGNLGGSATGAVILVWEISAGFDTTTPLDSGASAGCGLSNTNTTSPTVTSGAPAQSGDLFIAGWGSPSTASGLTCTANGSWLPTNCFGTGNTNAAALGAYLDGTGSGSAQTWAPTTPSKTYVTNMLAFKPAASAAVCTLGALGAGPC